MQYVCLLPKYFAHRAKYGIYNCIAGKIKAIAFKKKRNRCYIERDSSKSFIKDCKPENVQSVLKQEKELNA